MCRPFKLWRDSASLIIAAKSTFNLSKNFNYKLLCLKRSSKSGVMPNNYVFPGGNISKGDSNAQWLELFKNAGYDSNAFGELQPVENVPGILQPTEDETLPKMLSLRICAIRETFEECGILICKSRHVDYSDTNWTSYIGGDQILQWQDRVHDNPNEFIELCKQFDFYPDVWALKLWSNWVTPPSLKSKFDTVFFISTFYQMPDARPEETEIQTIEWATPVEYMIENLKENIMFPIPQFYEISRLKNFSDISQLMEFIKRRSKLGCETYIPYRVQTKRGLFSIFPGDGLYPEVLDKNQRDVTYLDELPDCASKNRLFHKSEYLNELVVENLTTKDGHLPPIVVNIST